MENQNALKVHTENIPPHVKESIGKAFLEAYLDFKNNQNQKGKEENGKELNNNICGAL